MLLSRRTPPAQPRPRSLTGAGGALFGTLILTAACGTASHGIPEEAPVDRGLRRLGSFVWLPRAADPQAAPASGLTVVVLDDRHSVSGRIRKESGPITRIRSQNRRAVGFLFEKGYRLLGAEFRLGPLPRDGVAKEHREKLTLLQRGFRRIDEWSLYQPLRYELELGRSGLLVRGVEDPALYDADVERFEGILAIRRARKLNPAPESLPELAAEERRLAAGITAQVDARGRAAAENLVRLAREGGHQRAMIMLGAAHTPSALKSLREAGVRTGHFRAQALDERSEEP